MLGTMPALLFAWFAFAVKPDHVLSSQFATIAKSINGRVGAAALIIESGESAAYHGSEHFPIESVCKLPIGMAVVKDIDRGDLTFDEKIRVLPADLVPPAMHSPLRDAHPHGAEISVRQLLEYAIQQSDGTASDVLLRLAGGTGTVTAFARSLGATGFSIEETENAIGRSDEAGYRNWATPEASMALLKALYEARGISLASRTLLLEMLSTSSTSTKRIQGLLPAGTIVAHKTGTSGTYHGQTRGTNDIGLVTLPDGRHLAIAVYLADSRADEPTREATIAKIAKAAWDRWAH
jgi:beta-lactamase class A